MTFRDCASFGENHAPAGLPRGFLRAIDAALRPILRVRSGLLDVRFGVARGTTSARTPRALPPCPVRYRAFHQNPLCPPDDRGPVPRRPLGRRFACCHAAPAQHRALGPTPRGFDEVLVFSAAARTTTACSTTPRGQQSRRRRMATWPQNAEPKLPLRGCAPPKSRFPVPCGFLRAPSSSPVIASGRTAPGARHTVSAPPRIAPPQITDGCREA